MDNNVKAIKIIEKYDNQLGNIKNSEGWYKYTLAIKELLNREDLLDVDEVEILMSYKESE